MNAALPIILEALAFRPAGRPVIDGLSARIATSGITAVIGPNGAGKSVTLRLIDGLLVPDEGTIRFGDRARLSLTRDARTGGVMPTTSINPRFDPIFTCSRLPSAPSGYSFAARRS